jgi:hypothetical protein|tara:strand:- start:168 stop:341 length:174 start_codon:yes stop_codon:yes gene_type:complete
MSNNDLKLAFINALTFGISFSAIENSLKIILLLASIIYTFQKIIESHKKKKLKENEK